MKTLKMLIFSALVAVLTGCGGGGGGSTPASTPGPVTPAPTVTLSWVSPADGVTGVADDLNSVVFALAVTNATASDASKLTFLCNSKSVAFVPGSALTVDGKSMVVSVSPKAGANLAGETCTISGGIVTTGPGGTVTTVVNTSFTFAVAVVVAPTCVAPQSWNANTKSCGYPGGLWVESSKQLPTGCVDSTQQCFKDVAKVVTSGIVLTGLNSRPVEFAFYQNVGPLWRELLIYADDGTVVDIVGNMVAGGSSAEIDKVMGTPTGLIVHQKATGICAEATWDVVAKKLAVAILPTCPVNKI